jgi:uncharacterized protein YgiM (DUF1202 family)
VRCSIKSFTCIPFLLLSVLAGSSSERAFASETGEGSVQARVVNIAPNDVLNIREHPTAESSIIGIIPPDSRDVTILGEAVGGWMHVRYGQIEGWVSMKFIVPEIAGWVGTGEPSTISQRTGRCMVSDPSGTSLNVRASPLGGLTGTIDNGAFVRVADTAEDYKGQPWAYIVGWEGGEQIGWVFREFVSCY